MFQPWNIFAALCSLTSSRAVAANLDSAVIKSAKVSWITTSLGSLPKPRPRRPSPWVWPSLCSMCNGQKRSTHSKMQALVSEHYVASHVRFCVALGQRLCALARQGAGLLNTGLASRIHRKASQDIIMYTTTSGCSRHSLSMRPWCEDSSPKRSTSLAWSVMFFHAHLRLLAFFIFFSLPLCHILLLITSYQ